jgi:hypothetical protein
VSVLRERGRGERHRDRLAVDWNVDPTLTDEEAATQTRHRQEKHRPRLSAPDPAFARRNPECDERPRRQDADKGRIFSVSYKATLANGAGGSLRMHRRRDADNNAKMLIRISAGSA